MVWAVSLSLYPFLYLPHFITFSLAPSLPPRLITGSILRTSLRCWYNLHQRCGNVQQCCGECFLWPFSFALFSSNCPPDYCMCAPMELCWTVWNCVFAFWHYNFFYRTKDRTLFYSVDCIFLNAYFQFRKPLSSSFLLPSRKDLVLVFWRGICGASFLCTAYLK